MKSAEKLTVATLAGLTMAATVATRRRGVREPRALGSIRTPQPAGLEAQAATTLAAPTMVKAKAVGTFAYDQTSVSPKADLVRFQGASSYSAGRPMPCRRWRPVTGRSPCVSGAVVDQFTATVGELVGEEPVNQLMTCSCGNPAGGRAIVTATDVKGLPVEYLLAKAGAVPEANTLTFVGADGVGLGAAGLCHRPSCGLELRGSTARTSARRWAVPTSSGWLRPRPTTLCATWLRLWCRSRTRSPRPRARASSTPTRPMQAF